MLHSTPEENQRVVLLTLKFTTELKFRGAANMAAG